MKNKIEIELKRCRNIQRSKSDQRGMTLVELLVVIAIIGILAAILFVGIGSIRERANRASAMGNLRALGQASAVYTAEHKGEIFPAYTRQFSPPGENSISWVKFIPYFYAGHDFEIMVTKGDDLANDIMPGTMRSAKAVSFSGNYITYYSYARNVELPKPTTSKNWVDAPARINILEAPGKTMLLIETRGNINADMYPGVVYRNYSESHFNFDRSGKTMVLFVDGHVESVEKAKFFVGSSSSSQLNTEKRIFWFGYPTANSRVDY